MTVSTHAPALFERGAARHWRQRRHPTLPFSLMSALGRTGERGERAPCALQPHSPLFQPGHCFGSQRPPRQARGPPLSLSGAGAPCPHSPKHGRPGPRLKPAARRRPRHRGAPAVAAEQRGGGRAARIAAGRRCEHVAGGEGRPPRARAAAMRAARLPAPAAAARAPAPAARRRARAVRSPTPSPPPSQTSPAAPPAPAWRPRTPPGAGTRRRRGRRRWRCCSWCVGPS